MSSDQQGARVEPRMADEEPKKDGIQFGTQISYDDAYNYGNGEKSEYVSELPLVEEERGLMGEEEDDIVYNNGEEGGEEDGKNGGSHPSTLLQMQKYTNEQNAMVEKMNDPGAEYRSRAKDRVVMEEGTSFIEAMQHRNLDNEKKELLQEAKAVDEKVVVEEKEKKRRRRRRRWDDSNNESNDKTPMTKQSVPEVSEDEGSVVKSNRWDEDADSKKRRKRWDETPVANSASVLDTPMAETPVIGATPVGVQWAETPLPTGGDGGNLVPDSASVSNRKRSRWDSTPLSITAPNMTPLSGDLAKALAVEQEMEGRNRPWTLDALDLILPSAGYQILHPPASYRPVRTPSRKLLSTPTPMAATGFHMPAPEEQGKTLDELREAYGVPITLDHDSSSATALPHINEEDYQYFGHLLTEVEEDTLTKEEQNERKIATLLLKIKSGTPPQRKTAMRQITDRARSFGAAPLFHQILPLLMSPTLEDQERHLLVKVVDRSEFYCDHYPNFTHVFILPLLSFV